MNDALEATIALSVQELRKRPDADMELALLGADPGYEPSADFLAAMTDLGLASNGKVHAAVRDAL